MTLALSILNWVVGTTVGRIAAAALAFLVAWQWNNAVQRGKGAALVYQDSKQAGSIANAKNETLRQKAKQPGAADRLRQSDCRDC